MTSPITTITANSRPMGYEQITGLSSAKGLTVPEGARFALVNVQDQNVRWRDDGDDPTAAVGMVLSSGDTFVYSGQLAAIKFIETDTSAELNVAYYH